MKNVKIIEGVVAEYKGKYWGIQYADGNSTSKDFGNLEKAEISNPKYCFEPTDMTWDPNNTNGNNHEYDKLKKAKLIEVKKTITTEIEIMDNTKQLAWWGYQTRLGKINLTKKYFPSKNYIDITEENKEFIYDSEHIEKNV